MKPEESQANLDKFWTEYIAIGKEVLKAGKALGYGMSLLEVKFQNGEPSVIIRSITQKTKYQSDADALGAIDKLLEDSLRGDYNGSMTFTVVMNGKGISQVLLDEYANRILK